MKTAVRVLRAVLTVSLLTTVAVPLAAPALAVAPAGTVSLVSPTEGETVGGNPTFTWTAVPGALKYRFQLSRFDTFSSFVYNIDTVNLHATPPMALPVGQLFWRVAPTDGSSGIGAFAQASFTRVWAEAPNLVAPAAEETLTYPDDPLLFRWDSLPGAKTYNFQIDDDVNFVSPLLSTATNNTTYTLVDPQTAGQQFFWRVQGNASGVVSPWSEPRGYSVDWPEKPVLIGPAGTTVTDVVFSWSPVTGAATYQLQVSPNPDFTNNITLDVVTKGTRYSPGSTIGNGSYFWRVRARDAEAIPNLGGWSSEVETSPGITLPAQFTRAWNLQPTLLTPSNNDFNVVDPRLSWTPVPHASHYEVWIGPDSTFTPGSYAQCVTNQTSLTPYSVETGYTNPAPTPCNWLESKPDIGVTMYWKVRGVDAPANVNGLFSDVSSFQYVHRDVPLALTPGDGESTSSPVLSWEPVLGASRYKVFITNTSGASVGGSPFTTYATSITPALSIGQSYKWWAVTLDEMDRVGPMPAAEDIRTFTYAAPAETFDQVQSLAPAELASSVVMPSMQWNPITDATIYRVLYRPVGASLFTELGNTTMTSFTYAGAPLNSGTYEWKVEAYNNTAHIDTSLVGSFVVGTLALAQNVSPVNCTPETDCSPVGDTPTLTWNPVPYAGGYLVYLARDAAFTNIERVYQTANVSFTPRESLLDSVAGQAWYWFVRPCRNVKSNVGCGRFDNEVFPTAYAFRKRSVAVQPLSPENDAVATGDVTFTWADYTATNQAATPASGQGARRYRIQVSTVADFATIVDTEDVDQTTYTPHDMTYPEGPLYWRVGVVDNSSNQLTFSTPRVVVKATPSLVPIHPASGSTESGTPYFQWAAQAHSSKYEVEVYKNGDTLFSSANKVVLSPTTTKLTAFTPTTSLPAGSYAWRVRRWDTNTPSARQGPWSSGGTFTVSKAAPTLVSPGNGSTLTNNDVVFSWTAVPGAAAYKFEASLSAGFGTTLEGVTTVMTSWAPVVKYGDGIVHWRVKVLDAADNVLAVSAVHTISKDSTVPKVLTKAPTTAATLVGGAFTATFSEPVKNLSASTFTMKVANTATSVPGVVTPDPTTASTTATFKPSVNLTPGESYTLTLSSAIVDVNGNPLTPFSWTVRAATVVDSVSPVVQHFWDRDAHTAASGGAFLASRTSGAKLTYTFTGTSVVLLGRRARDGGYGDVYLDGVRQGTASFYYGADQWRAAVWSKSGLTNTTHKVELRVNGTKPSASTSTWVYPDAFRVGTVTTEETSGAVVQSFRNVALTGALGGSYELNVHTASGDNNQQPYLTLRFKGTGVIWKGLRSTSGGLAGVYIDNAGKGVVDLYGSATTTGTAVWSISGLTNSTHTLRIVLTGGKRSTSSGYNVTFDSFTVI